MGTLKFFVQACRALNSRPATIILYVAGFIASILLFPRLYVDGLSRKEALSEIVVIFVPLLFAKLLNLTMLSFVDFSLSGSRESYKYRTSVEKARARTLRILLEKKDRCYTLDSVSLGSERLFLNAAAAILKAAGAKGSPPAVIVGEEPFVLARVTAEGADGVKAQFYSQDQRGQVLAKLISSSIGAPGEQ